MKVLFDTNVILDLLLDREPFVPFAAALLAKAERGELTGCVGATTITTIQYLATKVIGAKGARAAISKLLTVLQVAPVNQLVIDAALDSSLTDFEDAVLLEAARAFGADAIVTRDHSGFAAADLPVYDPVELVAALAT